MRVVILGAGYAGLTVTRRLERQLPSSVDIVLVDDTGTHLVQHELHRLVRRPELEETITIPLSEVVSRAEVREAKVTAVDTDEGVVTLDDEEKLEYDIGAVCLGSETAFYGLDSVEEHATPLKRLEDARQIRADTLTATDGDVVIGGAGFSGIQLAGELAALTDDRDLGLDIRLVEMADRIAPSFDATFAEALESELEARDVTIETGVAVESADEESVTLEDGRELPADVFVWTGGIAGPQALAGERKPAGADLRVGETTFVVGDAGEITDDTGAEAPASAQTAVRQARVVAANIRQLVEAADGETEMLDWEEVTLDTYEFDAPGWVVSVGDTAVARVGPVVMSGEPAKAAKATIGAGHLGSVGAIGRASDLVAEELGWPTVGHGDKQLDSLPTDPATPSEFQYPIAQFAFSLVDSFSGEETIDLTRYTRPTDTNHPGSPFNALRKGMFDAFDAAISFGGNTVDELVEEDEDVTEEESDDGPVDIPVEEGEDESSEESDDRNESSEEDESDDGDESSEEGDGSDETE